MNKNRITQSVILSLTTLLAALAWYCLYQALYGQTDWLWPIGGFFILLLFLSLTWILVESRGVLLSTLIIILVCFFFSFGFKIEYLAALFLAFLFFLFGSNRVLAEREARVKIQIHKIINQGLPFILTGLALIIATAVYFSPLALATQSEIEIPRAWFNFIIHPVMQNIGTPSPVDQDVLYQMVNEKINQYSQPYQTYFPFGLAIGLFFLLKAIGLPLSWLVILFSWLFFKILVNSGAIKIEQKAVLQEVIEL